MSLTDFTPFAEIHASLPQHRKTYALARILSQKRTTIVGMLIFLWLWALDDGTGIIQADPLSLADIMLWDGDPRLLAEAMLNTRLLDAASDNTWKIHDWDDYTGMYQQKMLTRREQNRQAQQKHRLVVSSNTTVSMTSALGHANVSRQPNRNPTVTQPEPNLTNNHKIPEWLDQETWGSFLEMRNSVKAPPTAKAKELLIKKLDKFRMAGDDPNEVLNQSIMNNWKGIFSLEGGNGNGNYRGNSQKGTPRAQRSYTRPEELR